MMPTRADGAETSGLWPRQLHALESNVIGYPWGERFAAQVRQGEVRLAIAAESDA